MKIIIILLATLLVIIQLSFPKPPTTEIAEVVTFQTFTPTPPPTRVYIDDEGYAFDDVLDDEGLVNVYTRPIAKRTVLRSKPWEDSKPNLETALVPGDIVQIHPNKFGESEWVEVWVPRYRVTGYIRLEMLGEMK